MANKESSSSIYESDFEEDSQSSEESNNDEKTKSVKDFASDKEKAAEKSSEREDVTFGDDDVFEEIMEFENENNDTEDITVEEEYLANNLNEFDYVEAIEPLEEDEKQEKRPGDTPVKDSASKTKCTDEDKPCGNQLAKGGKERKDEQKEGQDKLLFLIV